MIERDRGGKKDRDKENQKAMWLNKKRDTDTCQKKMKWQ